MKNARFLSDGQGIGGGRTGNDSATANRETDRECHERRPASAGPQAVRPVKATLSQQCGSMMAVRQQLLDGLARCARLRHSRRQNRGETHAAARVRKTGRGHSLVADGGKCAKADAGDRCSSAFPQRRDDSSVQLGPRSGEGLGEAGYVEGRNVAIEYRWATGHLDRLPGLAARTRRPQSRCDRNQGGERAAFAAKKATSTIPIVFQAAATRLRAELSKPRPAEAEMSQASASQRSSWYQSD